MTERLHAIFSAHAHQKFAIAAKIVQPRVVRPSKSVTLLNISPHWLREQIDNINPFRLSFQQRGRRAESGHGYRLSLQPFRASAKPFPIQGEFVGFGSHHKARAVGATS